MANQNKFTKSVLERLEQEEKKQKESSAPQKKEPTTKTEQKTVKKTTTSKAPVKKQAIKKQSVPETSPEPVAKLEELQEIPDLSAFLKKSTERTAKNKTFYLDADVIEGLHQVAQAQGMTDSRLVNEILRGVLGIS